MKKKIEEKNKHSVTVLFISLFFNRILFIAIFLIWLLFKLFIYLLLKVYIIYILYLLDSSTILRSVLRTTMEIPPIYKW